MAENTESIEDFPMPPANFAFLVESILMQAQMQLGLIKFGDENEQDEEPNLPLARHSVDLLAMLQEKTQGNLTAEEHRLLENGLTELRFRFVQVADGLKKEFVAEAPGLADAVGKDEGLRIITSDGGKGSKSE